MEKQEKNYKERVAGFKNRLETQTSSTPLQKIVPIKNEESNKKEIQLGVFISQQLMTKLKIKAASENKTIKEIVNKVLEENI